MAVILPRSAMIHVPKTGGNFCRTVIREMKIPHHESGPMKLHRHTSIERCYEEINKDKKRLTFGFTRNPLSWLRSKWSYACKTGALDEIVETRKESGRGGFTYECFSRDWEYYINAVVDNDYADQPSAEMYGRLGYKKSEDGLWVKQDIHVDLIGRTETLRDDLIEFLTKADERFDKQYVLDRPKRNVSSHEKEGEWPSHLKDKIIEANRQLIEQFDFWEYL